MAGTTRAQAKDGYAALDDTRKEHSLLVGDLNYGLLNRSGTVSPEIAIGAGSKIKLATAAATTYIAGGKATALGISGNYWDLTAAAFGTTVLVGGNNGNTIKYRLMGDSGQNAQIQSSSASGNNNANACTFGSPPANNNAILGMVTIAVSAGNNFTPGTTALDGTGVTTTIINGSDGSEFIAAALTP